ncbi:competence protein CoiA family protein [Kitasatospora purpeofusca]|uniref:competence protein CoiA family protein n=1 Tax=Kitasatospora purpeofusca TaxID=67352 RepID=UPI002A5A6A83|nr:competence protein CoiA family protein [Kitasatospora purpeofusca]MDY0812423.1 competence protein CoiA family protein [Kitasatospora purpeofusca]
MSDELFDHRKVQTAVIGDKHSDDPVLLPFEPEPLDAFRKRHQGATFWCGTLLGGCGKELTTKRYVSRVCHFAHHPPVHCNRTATGENSADHLFIKRAVDNWLRSQRIRAVADFEGAVPNGLIGLNFTAIALRAVVSIQFGRQSVSSWQARHADLTRRGTRQVSWLFGPETMLTRQFIDLHGHALRVACHTVDHTRQVRIGVESSEHRITWHGFDEFAMTESGIHLHGRAGHKSEEGRTPQVGAAAPVVSQPASVPVVPPSLTTPVTATVVRIISQPRPVGPNPGAHGHHSAFEARLDQQNGPAVRVCLKVPGPLPLVEVGVRYEVRNPQEPYKGDSRKTAWLPWVVEGSALARVRPSKAKKPDRRTKEHRLVAARNALAGFPTALPNTLRPSLSTAQNAGDTAQLSLLCSLALEKCRVARPDVRWDTRHAIADALAWLLLHDRSQEQNVLRGLVSDLRRSTAGNDREELLDFLTVAEVLSRTIASGSKAIDRESLEAAQRKLTSL